MGTLFKPCKYRVDLLNQNTLDPSKIIWMRFQASGLVDKLLGNRVHNKSSGHSIMNKYHQRLAFEYRGQRNLKILINEVLQYQFRFECIDYNVIGQKYKKKLIMDIIQV